eukprot:2098523-Amphidinium_carterae.1
MPAPSCAKLFCSLAVITDAVPVQAVNSGLSYAPTPSLSLPCSQPHLRLCGLLANLDIRRCRSPDPPPPPPPYPGLGRRGG